MSSILQSIVEFLTKSFSIGQLTISWLNIIILITAIFLASVLLKAFYRLYNKRLPVADRGKFKVVFGYLKWVVYTFIFFTTLKTVGVDVTPILAASAALLIGIGLALQTLFQDIISGILMLLDQSVHVGDVIEIDGKVGRIVEIKLRTTRAVTIDNKVMIIPNHFYLSHTLYNWTQNGKQTREHVSVGVAYGTDVKKVEQLLIRAATECEYVVNFPEPIVLFDNFGDSALEFRLVFTLEDSFMSSIHKSDVRFRINQLFIESNIVIPFPQRDLHIRK